MLTDPIADLLIRIKNGYQARKTLLKVPCSGMKLALAEILVAEGYLKEAKKEGKKKDKNKPAELKLTLKYQGKKPALIGVKRISKPGVRVYSKTKEIPWVKFGPGITVISTPEGLMTDKKARKKNLGGEVICQIW